MSVIEFTVTFFYFSTSSSTPLSFDPFVVILDNTECSSFVDKSLVPSPHTNLSSSGYVRNPILDMDLVFIP